MIGNFPDHPFIGQKRRPWTPGRRQQAAEPTDPDEICGAEMQLANEDEHGYSMWAQCGHTRAEHPVEFS